jgi:hypothetical protein
MTTAEIIDRLERIQGFVIHANKQFDRGDRDAMAATLELWRRQGVTASRPPGKVAGGPIKGTIHEQPEYEDKGDIE